MLKNLAYSCLGALVLAAALFGAYKAGHFVLLTPADQRAIMGFIMELQMQCAGDQTNHF